METAIVLAVAASLCTAASSVCQRMAARGSQRKGFDAGLMFRLARRPVWLLGIASMIGGFLLQLTALHFGALALVQPILAGELVFVFGYLVMAGGLPGCVISHSLSSAWPRRPQSRHSSPRSTPSAPRGVPAC
jgi:hypothetical protein